MATIGLILMGIGGLVMFVGGLWLLVVAFQTSVLWGLGSLFIPFVGLVFLIMHFDVARKPFFLWLGGLAVGAIGAALSGQLSAGPAY